jgi:hypothetical protein
MVPATQDDLTAILAIYNDAVLNSPRFGMIGWSIGKIVALGCWIDNPGNRLDLNGC